MAEKVKRCCKEVIAGQAITNSTNENILYMTIRLYSTVHVRG